MFSLLTFALCSRTGGFQPAPRTFPSAVRQHAQASDFDLNKGRCLDVLKQDSVTFFDRPLSWDIYSSRLKLRDPAGIELVGLEAYKQVFFMVRALRKVSDVDVRRSRVWYNDQRRAVVVHWYTDWNFFWMMKTSVDGISTFHLDDNGKVYRHEIDKLMYDGTEQPTPVSMLGYSFAQLVTSANKKTPAYASKELMLVSSGGEKSESADESRTEKSRGKNGGEPKPANKGGFLGKCEYMWDCEFPLECCNWGIVKVCCGGGGGVTIPLSPVPIPIPVPARPQPNRRPDGYM